MTCGCVLQVRALTYSSGGPVVMVQIENEFGSYGDVRRAADRQYIVHLVDMAQQYLGNTQLYTTDGPLFLSRGPV